MYQGGALGGTLQCNYLTSTPSAAGTPAPKEMWWEYLQVDVSSAWPSGREMLLGLGCLWVMRDNSRRLDCRCVTARAAEAAVLWVVTWVLLKLRVVLPALPNGQNEQTQLLTGVSSVSNRKYWQDQAQGLKILIKRFSFFITSIQPCQPSLMTNTIDFSWAKITWEYSDWWIRPWHVRCIFYFQNTLLWSFYRWQL